MTTPATKTQRGRPPTGRTPDKERSASSKAALLEAGGRRLNVNLSPEATLALAKVRQLHPTDRAAVEDALINRASSF